MKVVDIKDAKRGDWVEVGSGDLARFVGRIKGTSRVWHPGNPVLTFEQMCERFDELMGGGPRLMRSRMVVH